MIFRVEDVPVASRLEYLHQSMAETLVPLDIRPAVGPAGLRETSVTRDAGGVRVVAMTLSPGEAARTPRLIRRSDPGLCKIDVLSSGSLVVDQDGRQAELGPGDLTFVDFSRPCAWMSRTPVEGVAVMFPRELLPLRDDELARLTGQRIRGHRGAAGLASTLARQLPDHLVSGADGNLARLGASVVDLMSVALATRLDRGAAAAPAQGALVVRIQAFIEQHLADPGLSPATVAAAHHISVRYLHKLFQEWDSTVAGWIRRRRLERCRLDLLDPRLRSRPVGAIGARWGFVNAGHFNNVFRTAYDTTPGEYRRSVSARERNGRALRDKDAAP
jgi:AraC-like DNA-binding protein